MSGYRRSKRVVENEKRKESDRKKDEKMEKKRAEMKKKQLEAKEKEKKRKEEARKKALAAKEAEKASKKAVNQKRKKTSTPRTGPVRKRNKADQPSTSTAQTSDSNDEADEDLGDVDFRLTPTVIKDAIAILNSFLVPKIEDEGESSEATGTAIVKTEEALDLADYMMKDGNEAAGGVEDVEASIGEGETTQGTVHDEANRFLEQIGEAYASKTVAEIVSMIRMLHEILGKKLATMSVMEICELAGNGSFTGHLFDGIGNEKNGDGDEEGVQGDGEIVGKLEKVENTDFGEESVGRDENCEGMTKELVIASKNWLDEGMCVESAPSDDDPHGENVKVETLFETEGDEAGGEMQVIEIDCLGGEIEAIGEQPVEDQSVQPEQPSVQSAENREVSGSVGEPEGRLGRQEDSAGGDVFLLLGAILTNTKRPCVGDVCRNLHSLGVNANFYDLKLVSPLSKVTYLKNQFALEFTASTQVSHELNAILSSDNLPETLYRLNVENQGANINSHVVLARNLSTNETVQASAIRLITANFLSSGHNARFCAEYTTIQTAAGMEKLSFRGLCDNYLSEFPSIIKNFTENGRTKLKKIIRELGYKI